MSDVTGCISIRANFHRLRRGWGYAEYALAQRDVLFSAARNVRRCACRSASLCRNHRIPQPPCGRNRTGRPRGSVRIRASGHLAIAVLRAWNFEVYVSTLGESHRALAPELGADWEATEKDQTTSPIRPDRYLRAERRCGIAALSALRKGGIVAINAIHLGPDTESDYDRLLSGERQIGSVVNMTRTDSRDFLRLRARSGSSPR